MVIRTPASLTFLAEDGLAGSGACAQKSANASEHEGNWQARWIVPFPPSQAGDMDISNTWYAVRKTFHLKTLPTRCMARIAVDSKYWLHVNGKIVVREGGLKRGPSPCGTYYDVVDLSPYLSTGDNVVAILIWYFGRSGYSHNDSGCPGLLFQADMDGAAVVSDASWRMMRLNAYSDAGYIHDGRRLPESSICFDACKEIGPWYEAGYDDSGWAHPRVADPAGGGPWGDLEPRGIPQWRWSELRDYLAVEEKDKFVGGRVFEAKLPYDCQVTPALEVDSSAGLKIQMFSDSPTLPLMAEYITKEGHQSYESPGWIVGHKVIYVIPEEVKIIGLHYRESGYDSDFAGSFTSDDADLNILWDKSRRTLYVTMRDTFMDCPCRERAQWWGDEVIQLGMMFYCLDHRSHALVGKGIRELANWQRPDGVIFSPIPNGKTEKELPVQMLAVISRFGLWTYYLNTGDVETLRYSYPAVHRYLNLWKLDSRGLVVYRTGDWDWLDWGENIDSEALQNAWYYLALEGDQRISRELGQEADAKRYFAERDAMKKVFHKTFWTDAGYRSPGYTGLTDDRTQALAVLSGLAETSAYPRIKEILLKERHASPYMEKWVLEALFQLGEGEAAVKRMKSRYAPMIHSDLSTLWELFPDATAEIGTYNHSWSGGPLTLLSQYAAGVSPLVPGWRKFMIRPQMGNLKKIDAVIPIPFGEIRVNLEVQADSLIIKVSVPPGTEALVDGSITMGKPAVISEFHGSVRRSDQSAQKDGLHIILPPGEWQVTYVSLESVH